MYRLESILFSIVATTLMGSFVVAALTLGYDTLRPILVSAGAGFVLAIPATLVIARLIRASG